MNKKRLVKIINNELAILNDIISEFSKEGEVHPFEVDMALSKIKEMYGQLLLLKENESAISLQVQNQLDGKAGVSVAAVKDESIIESLPEKAIEKKLETLVSKEILPQIESIEIKEPTKEEVLEIKEASSTEEVLKVEPITEIKEPETDEPNEKDIPKTGKELISEQLMQLAVEEETIPVQVQEVLTEPTQPIAKEMVPDSNENSDRNSADSKASNSSGAIKTTTIADKFQNQSTSLNEKLSGIKKDKDLASSLKDKPLHNLKSAIKLNDRIWFTNELFGKNKVLFERTVDIVNQAASLDEALTYLNSNFTWDQNQKSTVNFLELVIRRFSN